MGKTMDSNIVSKKKLFRPDEVAILIFKSKRTIYRWIKNGRINVVIRNGSSWIPKGELERLMEGL